MHTLISVTVEWGLLLSDTSVHGRLRDEVCDTDRI